MWGFVYVAPFYYVCANRYELIKCQLFGRWYLSDMDTGKESMLYDSPSEACQWFHRGLVEWV